MDVYHRELRKRNEAKACGQVLFWLLIMAIVLTTYQAVHEVPEQPTRQVICDSGCYWIDLDDSTRCRVFRGEHIPNRDWPMLCEVNGRTIPYQEYLKTRGKVD